MQSQFWTVFTLSTCVKILLAPSTYSSDFHVHRNWLAITHSLPLSRWYVDETNQWTLDYPPFFAYFEWILSQVARFVDPKMLIVRKGDYDDFGAIVFQRYSVMIVDFLFAYGVWRCLSALKISRRLHKHFAAELILLFNVGLMFVDHIHFQYNGMLFGILLLSISFLLENRPLMAAFTFAVLLNFKHIFLYMAPAFAVYLLKFYCMDGAQNPLLCFAKLCGVGLTPFILAFGTFWDQIPQVLSRLFPFKRGLTHAYWAPNFWAIYNGIDKLAAHALGKSSGPTTTSGLVQEFEHDVLPTITPTVTFILTAIFMLPVLVKLFFYTKKSDSTLVFLRALVLCACASFMFGWHVHEKAILMCLIPLSFLYILELEDAKYAFILSFAGYFSLFPLLFELDLIFIRYAGFIAYMVNMYSQVFRIFARPLKLYLFEKLYLFGFLLIPIYEHVISVMFELSDKLPFMPLMLTSLYCSLGVLYFFLCYYWYTLQINFNMKKQQPKNKTSAISSKKAKLKLKSK